MSKEDEQEGDCLGDRLEECFGDLLLPDPSLPLFSTGLFLKDIRVRMFDLKSEDPEED